MSRSRIPASASRPEHLDHIFGEFNQVEDERNRKYEGTGLGLTITRRLIERMGGAVWVDSEPGKGSVFGFRVTFQVAESAQPTHPVRVQRALVVDDQFINRTILERQLTPCGIEVTLCRSGAEALAALAADASYDVVLTDHEMPEMDGLALARQIRAGGHRMPILLLSSNPGRAGTRCRADSGCDPAKAGPARRTLRPSLWPDRKPYPAAAAAGSPPGTGHRAEDAGAGGRGQQDQPTGVSEDGAWSGDRAGLCRTAGRPWICGKASAPT
jgi:CheY-like chemotaxis protein